MKAILKEKLKQYSMDLFGTSSRWEKLLKDPGYRIVVSESKTDEPEYLYYQSANGKKTVMRTQTVKNKHLPLPDLSQGGVEYKWRQPSEEEMLYILYNARIQAAIHYLSESEQVAFAAYFYVTHKAMYNSLYLFCSESELESVMLSLPDNLKGYVVTAKSNGNMYISATDFVKQYSVVKLVTLQHQDQEFDKLVNLAMMNKRQNLLRA